MLRSFLSPEELFCQAVTVTLGASKVWATNLYSMQFQQVKSTLRKLHTMLQL